MQLKQIETSEDAGSLGQLGIRYNEFRVSASIPGGDSQLGVENVYLSKAFLGGW